MGEIAAFVLDGHRRLARGGIEVGGGLYGTRTLWRIRVYAWRPIACEHAFGPGFTLSDKDERGLEEMFERASKDRELTGLHAVGWFRSSTRGQPRFQDQDVQFYDRHFPEPWQLVMLWRPGGSETADASVFLRVQDEGVTEVTESRMFNGQAPGASQTLPPPALLPAVPLPRFAQVPPPRPSRSPAWVAWILTAACIALALAVIWHIWGFPWQGAPEKPPSVLQLSETQGQLWIGWDAGRPEIAGAAGAELFIEDGAHSEQRRLSKTELLAGGASYVRQTEDVNIHLTAYPANAGDRAIDWQARFVGAIQAPAIVEQTGDQVEEAASALREPGAAPKADTESRRKARTPKK